MPLISFVATTACSNILAELPLMRVLKLPSLWRIHAQSNSRIDQTLGQSAFNVPTGLSSGIRAVTERRRSTLCMHSAARGKLLRLVSLRHMRRLQETEKPKWLLSCYGHQKLGPNDLKGDASMEEVRWMQYQVRGISASSMLGSLRGVSQMICACTELRVLPQSCHPGLSVCLTSPLAGKALVGVQASLGSVEADGLDVAHDLELH
eukprot:scaffold24057_cov20-Tisochrysis_lutea.AAC.2